LLFGASLTNQSKQGLNVKQVDAIFFGEGGRISSERRGCRKLSACDILGCHHAAQLTYLVYPNTLALPMRRVFVEKRGANRRDS